MVWDLLETKADLINSAVKSIKIPELSGQNDFAKYELWGGKVENLSVPKAAVSFQDMSNGVRINVKGVQFRASVKARVEIGKNIFGKWIHLPRMTGGITANSEKANLDVMLQWDDFKFVPTITMDSKISLSFTSHLKIVNLSRGKLQELVSSKVNSEVPKKIAEAVENHVNPHLQQLKLQMLSKGFGDYDIEWTVQNSSLRVAVKPNPLFSGKSTSSKITPIDNMACLNANIITVLAWLPLG
ncbi:hypothetical protein OESDEN_23136 [Oesophagostomum dentatum]|uniref:Lipid-binding serum glycoprotein N-terminal domain-containing protein n=1 Tax=Oesophagostomum dentatum TaxID=61180 RepID=A0A0B1RX43_OESDE|nr:hypothetical protein OESDEN_23136 [Oesophagostomum dentatum]